MFKPGAETEIGNKVAFLSDPENLNYINFGVIGIGDSFGEPSALSDYPNFFTIITTMPTVAYKIHRHYLLKEFECLTID